MNYIEIDMIQKLGETGSLRLAADQLSVSPQYLSRSIRNLEERYHTVFFYRVPNFRLTYEGELLLETARRMSLLRRNCESDLEDMQAEENYGTLQFGSADESIRLHFPQLIACFRDRHPHISVSIIERAEPRLFSMIENGQLDLYFGICLNARPELELYSLAQEKLYLFIPDTLFRRHFHDYPLCIERFRNGASIEEMLSIPFLENRSEAYLSQQLSRHLQTHHLSPDYVYASGSAETLLELCGKGIGALIGPERYRTLHSMGGSGESYIHQIPLRDFDCEYHIDIAYAKDRHLSHTVTQFIQVTQQFFLDQLKKEERTTA